MHKLYHKLKNLRVEWKVLNPVSSYMEPLCIWSMTTINWGLRYQYFCMFPSIKIANVVGEWTRCCLIAVYHYKRRQTDKWLLESFSSLLKCRGGVVGAGGGGLSNCIFWSFSPPKAFCYDPPKLRNFRESPTPTPPPFLITTPHFMKLLGKTFKCKMKIMGENQMRKLQWTQTIIIILLIQTEQIPTSEQNNQWICKLKKSLNQRRS